MISIDLLYFHLISKAKIVNHINIHAMVNLLILKEIESLLL